jgi:S-DNA-T family DNA segregation ATPase FtsK/SpoIIIE
VSVGRKARHERISAAFDRFHATVRDLLTAATRLSEGAAREHAQTMVELWLRREGMEAARVDPRMQGVLANPRVAAAVRRVVADEAAAFDGWFADGPDRLADLMHDHAPAAAGTEQGWLPQNKDDVSAREGPDGVPQLWRIGCGAVGAGDGSGALPAAGAVRFPVGVPLLDESHLQVDTRPRVVGSEAERVGRRATAEALVEALVLRAVASFRPGLVYVHVWDVGHLTGSLPGLYPLTRTGLLTVHDPGNLEGLLDELADRIRRVHTRVLVDGHPSLQALARDAQQWPEPWVVAVLVGDGTPLRDEELVQRVLRGGLACGISLVLVDVPMTIGAPLETVRLNSVRDGAVSATVATSSMTGPHVTVLPDPPLPRKDVIAACRAVAEKHDEWRSRAATFERLLPGPHDKPSKSQKALCAPVGFVDGDPRELLLADVSPHVLVGGPSGSGKTNLLLTMICSLTTRYSPDELELYLLDFKEGVSFAQFAPRRGRWLPHARLIGININTDREFGLALLQHLAGVMRERAEAAKAHEVTKLEELRAVDKTGRWPRIVAVIDEFQYLFGERDAVTNQAVQLLEDLARRGRSQGIHLVLASQDVSGIQAFWMRPAIFEQFVVRIGLPRARRVLTENNDATMHLARWHAVVNHESGVPHGNEVLRIPEASKEALDHVLDTLHAEHPGDPGTLHLFDGSKAPQATDLIKLMSVTDPPKALIGQCIDVDGCPAAVALPAVPGRNIGVIGADGTDAVRVLAAAARSLDVQHRLGRQANFVLAPLVAEAHGPSEALARQLYRQPELLRLDKFAERIAEWSKEVVERLSHGDHTPTYLVLYAADAADALQDRTLTENLRKVLRFGPEVGVHTIGWWRSPARLRSLLSMSASPDDLGSFLALDVQGAELGTLAPPGLLPVWSPRPGRALWFDRARHSRPEVVIVPAVDDRPADLPDPEESA